MEFHLSEASAAELQERYVLAPTAPTKDSRGEGGEHLDYFFELDGIRMGWVGLFNNTAKQHTSWSQFYPLCVHLTEAEVREESWLGEEQINTHMDYYRRELCNYHRVLDGIEGKGLGVLAHTLVVRHLCESVLNADAYTMSYADRASIKPGLVSLLHAAGIEETMEKHVPLTEVHSKLVAYARRRFGFQFPEST